MPPTQPLRPPVARFLATSSEWLRRDSADVRRIEEARQAAGRSNMDHSETMAERELIDHRRRLRALWIAQWQASLQEKLGVTAERHGVAAPAAEMTSQSSAHDSRRLATHTD